MFGVFDLTKENLKGYYRNLREIKRLQRKTERLKEQRQKIIDAINNDNVFLEADVRAVSLDNISASPRGFHISPQEKAVDTAYRKLDDKQNELYYEIVEAELLIGEIQLANADTEYFLQNLDCEDLKLIELYFRDRKTFLQISFELNMSVSTVNRRLNKILDKNF